LGRGTYRALFKAADGSVKATEERSKLQTSKKIDEVVTNNGPAISRKLDSGEDIGPGSPTTPVLTTTKNRID